ncbi:MAG: stage IV sporulation protein A [Bacilli bacterium]
MDKKEIIESISAKANGEILLGVVGAVRTGKSTFIKRFIETLVVPNIEDEVMKKRCLDEIPQSAQGKTIMTIEPKFVPSSGANIKIDEFSTNIKLIDCVGYVIKEAKGYEDEFGNPRMVRTPWFTEELPFIDAAEIGTEKVIKDHSTIGIVLTTDGSIGEISRNSYQEVEDKVINELKNINKPFIVIFNTKYPNSNEVKQMVEELHERHGVPIIPVSVETMTEKDILYILKEALYEFPVENISVNIPDWIGVLSNDHPIKKTYIEAMKSCVSSVEKLRDIDNINLNFEENDVINNAYISNLNTVNGEVTLNLDAPDSLYDEVLKEIIGVSINTRGELLKVFQDFSIGKSEYEGIKSALKQVYQTGYGIAFPKIDDMKLETPEVIKQGGRYGVKLKAIASSIHMIKVDVESTFEPIIGSETQSKELIDFLLKDQKENPNGIWKSEIFGRSLELIVQEGIQAKLSLLPESARQKLASTVTKMVNKGSNTLIAIVL